MLNEELIYSKIKILKKTPIMTLKHRFMRRLVGEFEQIINGVAEKINVPSRYKVGAYNNDFIKNDN
jgi:hypothetical protein